MLPSLIKVGTEKTGKGEEQLTHLSQFPHWIPRHNNHFNLTFFLHRQWQRQVAERIKLDRNLLALWAHEGRLEKAVENVDNNGVVSFYVVGPRLLRHFLHISTLWHQATTYMHRSGQCKATDKDGDQKNTWRRDLDNGMWRDFRYRWRKMVCELCYIGSDKALTTQYFFSPSPSQQKTSTRLKVTTLLRCR